MLPDVLPTKGHMRKPFAIIAGAVILFVAALAASLAFMRSGSSSAPASTSSTPAATTTGSHQMSNGSTMGGMNMGGN